MSEPTVFCSGPMFSPEDKWGQFEIAGTLERDARDHFKTFLAPRDGLEVDAFMSQLRRRLPQSSGAILATAPFVQALLEVVLRCIFALDMYQLIKVCDCVVFNMNGRVPDEGSVVEAAAGFAAGKPVVLYKETPIAMISGQDNPMVSGLSYKWDFCREIEEIPDAVREAIARHKAVEYAPPPQLAESLILGHLVWDTKVGMQSGAQGPPKGFDPSLLAKVTWPRLLSLSAEHRADALKAAGLNRLANRLERRNARLPNAKRWAALAAILAAATPRKGPAASDEALPPELQAQ